MFSPFYCPCRRISEPELEEAEKCNALQRDFLATLLLIFYRGKLDFGVELLVRGGHMR